jgi:hypothetical protein
MSEINELNQMILLRVNSFRISLSRNTVAIDRTVMARFKAQMEAILGHIYEHSESLPGNVVLERFCGLSDDIERETRAVETQLYHEHERNDQLQREAAELGNSLHSSRKSKPSGSTTQGARQQLQPSGTSQTGKSRHGRKSTTHSWRQLRTTAHPQLQEGQ